MTESFVIHNEQEAFDFLEKLNNGTISIGSQPLKFDGWPTMHIHLQGEKFNGTITPTIMKGLLELQKNIYQSYGLIRYGDANTQRLTKEERDELEINVKVSGGSSNYDINFQELLTTIFSATVGKMTPDAALVLVLGFSLMYFSASSLKTFLDNRKEIRLRDIESEEQRASIEALRFSSEQETKRTEILTQAMSHQPIFNAMSEHSKDFKTVMLKALSVSESISLQNVEISGDIAQELSINARRTWQDARLDGVFRIYSVDSSNLTQLKVKIQNISNNNIVIAIVQDQTMDSRHRTAIQNAEWSRQAIELTINAKELNGDFKDAVIIAAKEISQPQPPQNP
jgi:hypothetical protein